MIHWIFDFSNSTWVFNKIIRLRTPLGKCVMRNKLVITAKNKAVSHQSKRFGS